MASDTPAFGTRQACLAPDKPAFGFRQACLAPDKPVWHQTSLFGTRQARSGGI
ncbi:hypothetical protein [Echinicola soli]|uniref:hypothetical protein n=1 Tax=Echinicola soli TaxID=2591634 RepID=UPI00143CC559|nr:hypothetical protein [Echinicola soli]